VILGLLINEICDISGLHQLVSEIRTPLISGRFLERDIVGARKPKRSIIGYLFFYQSIQKWSNRGQLYEEYCILVFIYRDRNRAHIWTNAA